VGKRDAATIGAFVVGALALVVAAVLLWGSGRLFRQTAEYVCYFEGSVNGLEPGAPVKARGVPVGKVTGIQLSYRQRPDSDRLPVFIELDVKRLAELGLPDATSPQMHQAMIARGLRARLESQSIITGTLFVNLGMFPDTPIVLSQADQAGAYREIPTVPTPIAEVGKAATTLLTNLESLDLASAVQALQGAAVGFDRLVSSGNLPRALAEAVATMKAYRQLADNVDAGLSPLLAQLQAATGDARRTLGGLDGAAGAAGRLVGPQGHLPIRLREALTDVSRAANAVRELADYLRRNPNALLVGRSR
jgi:paraquat-inducible protein B